MHPPDSDAARSPKPGLAALFAAFFGISVMGFGGVMPWARWMVVERRGWLTPEEFNEAMALCQFLPGGNITNFGVIVGNRFCGAAGAAAAVTGMMVAPFGIVLVLAVLYSRVSEVAGVSGALDGVSAGAAGLVTAMVMKMAVTLKGEWVAILAAAVAFAAVGVFRLPLFLAVVVLAPLTIAYAWRRV